MTKSLVGSLVALTLALPLAAQQPQQQPATLTLDEALELARRNNPTYRSTVNDEGDADWGARQAYAALIPSVSVNNYYSYLAAGTPRLGDLSAAEFGLSEQPAVLSSGYGLNLNLNLSGQVFFRARQQIANQRSVEATITAAGFTLVSDVTRQYLLAVRQRDAVRISRSALEAAEEAHRLVEARFAAGAATRLEQAQSEVLRGRAEVALIQAQNLYDAERLRLAQILGVEIGQNLELTTDFQIFEPTWTEEDLIARALGSHPQLQARRRAESAANAASKAQWSEYLPSLSLSAGWSGYVSQVNSTDYVIGTARSRAQDRIDSCESNNALNARLTSPLPGWPKDCSQFAYTDAAGQAAIEANDVFPFNYSTSPARFTAVLSFPIFNGFQRERQLQQARAAAEDARYLRRAEELQRRTDVTTNLLALRAAWQTVQLEEKNAAAANEALRLAQERYRLGAGSIIELTQAQEAAARADQAHLAARYTFHETLAALENAVGAPLRTPGDVD
jgi:outer membrane protein